MIDSDAGRRALDAAEDLVSSLRLAHSAVQRIENELYGPVLKDADNLSLTLHRVRQVAEQLRAEVEHFVRDEQIAAARPPEKAPGRPRPAH